MIPPIYENIDALFVRTNFTDLFAKLALLLAVNILVSELGKTLRNKRALRFAAGLPGRTILVLTFALEMAIFAFIDTPAPSPGLGAYIDSPLVLFYNGVTVTYIAFLGALITGPLIKDAFGPARPFRKAASALLAAGFIVAIVRAVLLFAGMAIPGSNDYEIGQTLSAISALLVIIGLGSAWLALRLYGTPRIIQSHLRAE